MDDWNAENDSMEMSSVFPDGSSGQSNPNNPAYQYVFNNDGSVADGQDGDTIISQRSNAMATSSAKRHAIPTIATIYEPKFFEIYQVYQQYVLQTETENFNQNLHQQHLMTLCLNNLLPFSNWARDSSNAQWIRATLFENPDMRPEVRNGLAMIIVYVFAAGKAADMRTNGGQGLNVDMFTVLMKADSGLGIVNKTSLKIYSDPHGYFNFVKVHENISYLGLFLTVLFCIDLYVWFNRCICHS